MIAAQKIKKIQLRKCAGGDIVPSSKVEKAWVKSRKRERQRDRDRERQRVSFRTVTEL